jgi:hypothetical protein
MKQNYITITTSCLNTGVERTSEMSCRPMSYQIHLRLCNISVTIVCVQMVVNVLILVNFMDGTSLKHLELLLRRHLLSSNSAFSISIYNFSLSHVKVGRRPY